MYHGVAWSTFLGSPLWATVIFGHSKRLKKEAEVSLLVRREYDIACANQGCGEKSRRKEWKAPSSVSGTLHVCFQSGAKSGGNPL